MLNSGKDIQMLESISNKKKLKELEIRRKNLANEYITANKRWCQSFLNIEQISWSKYPTIESLPDEITIHTHRVYSIGGIIATFIFCIAAVIKITPIAFKIVMVGFMLVILINEILKLINRKFFLKISKKGITKPDNKIITWKQISFVVIELKHRRNTILIKKTNNPYLEELTIVDSNFSIQKVGHLIYLYQKYSDGTDSNSR